MRARAAALIFDVTTDAGLRNNDVGQSQDIVRDLGTASAYGGHLVSDPAQQRVAFR